MKASIEQTNEWVPIIFDAESKRKLAARIWEGFTDSGLPVQMLVIAMATPDEHIREFSKQAVEEGPETEGHFPNPFVL